MPTSSGVASRTMRMVDSISLPRFAWITELKKEAGADAVRAKVFASRIDLLDANVFVHRVKDALRSGLSSHPHLFAARAAQCAYGVAGHQIATGLHLKGNLSPKSFHGRGEFEGPPRRKGEDIVGEPDMVRLEPLF